MWWPTASFPPITRRATQGCASGFTRAPRSRRIFSPPTRTHLRSARSNALITRRAACTTPIPSRTTWRPGLPARQQRRASTAACATPGSFSPKRPILPRAYASHMPQIVNKSLANEIFDRFVISPDGPAYDEWSLYFNVAQQLYPRHFATKPYGALGWPMRPGDWLPEIDPMEPAFENYYPQNYEIAERGMFVGLNPLGDLEAKASRSRGALAGAVRA